MEDDWEVRDIFISSLDISQYYAIAKHVQLFSVSWIKKKKNHIVIPWYGYHINVLCINAFNKITNKG